MNQEILQWIGYSASIIIAASMTMSSIVKFRWINLAGASTFAIYGFLIGAMPVGMLNLFIVSVDIFYLVRIYNKNELFDTLKVRGDNNYLLAFLKFHHDEIQQYFPGFTYKPEMNTISFFVLRNMTVAGIFLAHREGDNTLKVGLDFVVPQYRDYKNGKFIYHRLKKHFGMAGFNEILVESHSNKYETYLKKMCFEKQENGMYMCKID